MALLKDESEMTRDMQGEVTRLLAAHAAGNPEALNQLFELVYGELLRMANGKMRDEHVNPKLEPTALVHLVYERLTCAKNFAKNVAGKERRYFFGAATKAMKNILVERVRQPDIRFDHIPIDWVLDWLERTHRIDILELHEALEQLEQKDSRQHEVVMLRFFGGLTMQEIADDLDVCLSTVEKDWNHARAWLKMKLETNE